MKKGKALHPGDTIGVIAPSSPAAAEAREKAYEAIRELGFQVKMGKSCYETYGGYLAGTAQERARELNEMFVDPAIDGILCLRGGYGSPQLLGLIEYERIANHPKLFIGYSDITALHIALLQRAGLATLHGPMGASDLAKGMDPCSLDYFLRAITEKKPLGAILNPEGEEIGCIVGGKATGAIVGGNLALVSATMGTPYELDTKGKLLFLEDIGEEPFKVDRMFTQLALAGKFEDAAGVILGTWTDCESTSYRDGFNILEVAHNIIAPFGKPTIYNVQAGHGKTNITLPFGVKASLDATEKKLVIEESVVA